MVFKMLLVLLLGLLVCSTIGAREPVVSGEEGSSREHKTFIPNYRGGPIQGVRGSAFGGGGHNGGGGSGGAGGGENGGGGSGGGENGGGAAGGGANGGGGSGGAGGGGNGGGGRGAGFP